MASLASMASSCEFRVDYEASARAYEQFEQEQPGHYIKSQTDFFVWHGLFHVWREIIRDGNVQFFNKLQYGIRDHYSRAQKKGFSLPPKVGYPPPLHSSDFIKFMGSEHLDAARVLESIGMLVETLTLVEQHFTPSVLTGICGKHLIQEWKNHWKQNELPKFLFLPHAELAMQWYVIKNGNQWVTYHIVGMSVLVGHRFVHNQPVDYYRATVHRVEGKDVVLKIVAKMPKGFLLCTNSTKLRKRLLET